MKNILIIIILLIISTNILASKVKSTGSPSDWVKNNAWDLDAPSSSSTQYDTIVILAGHTVKLKETIDLSSWTSPVYIILDGALQIVNSDSPGELLLPEGSAISISATGKIESHLVIKICAGNDTICNSSTVGPAYFAQTGTNLPVTLLDYTYNYKTQNLEWTTASEENNDYFTIDVIDKEGTITQTYNVLGNGNTNIIKKYNLYLIENDIYIHVTQTDYDGKINDLFTTYIRQQKHNIYIIHNIDNIEINGNYNHIQIINMNGVETKYDLINNKIYGLKRGFYIFILDKIPYKVVY